MNRLTKLMFFAAVGGMLTGCVLPAREIARMSTNTRTDIFVETPAEGSASVGFVDLVIKASIKVPLDEYEVLESNTPAQRTPSYPFLLNIDGQAVLWAASGQREIFPLYDKDGYASRNPDAGDGIKYRLEKRIRLAAGPHKIVFALPKRDYLSEFKISLNEGESQVLEFKPLYRFIEHPVRMPAFRTTFLRGVERYEAVLGGLSVLLLLTSAPMASSFCSRLFKVSGCD